MHCENGINDIHTPGNNSCLNSGQINMSFVGKHLLLLQYIFMMIVTHFLIMTILTITLSGSSTQSVGEWFTVATLYIFYGQHALPLHTF